MYGDIKKGNPVPNNFQKVVMVSCSDTQFPCMHPNVCQQIDENYVINL